MRRLDRASEGGLDSNQISGGDATAAAWAWCRCPPSLPSSLLFAYFRHFSLAPLPPTAHLDGRTGVPPAAGGSVPGRTFSGAWGCCTAKQVCHRLREKCKFFFRTVASCKRNKQTSIILNKYKRSVGAEEDPVRVRGQNFDTACGCVILCCLLATSSKSGKYLYDLRQLARPFSSGFAVGYAASPRNFPAGKSSPATDPPYQPARRADFSTTTVRPADPAPDRIT